jgi:hypothetical protein
LSEFPSVNIVAIYCHSLQLLSFFLEKEMNQNFVSPSKMQEEKFSQATRSFFYLLTLLGFRPFSIHNESWKIGERSIVGHFFWLLAISLLSYITFKNYNEAIFSIFAFGFFNFQTAIQFVMILSYITVVIYLVISFIFASVISTLLEKLDTVILTAQSFSIFRNFSRGSIVVTTLIWLFLTLFLIKTFFFHTNPCDTNMDAFECVYNYLSYFSVMYPIAVLSFPLGFFSLVSFFMYKAFSDQLDYCRNFSRSPIEAHLPSLYVEYLNLTDILEYADRFFSFVTGSVVSISIVSICLYVLYIDGFGSTPAQFYWPWLFLMVSNFVGYGCVCTVLNDKVSQT